MMDVIEAGKQMEGARRRLERADRALTAAMREMTAVKQAHTVSVANFDAASGTAHMKPVRKTAARVIEYWECSVSTHRHTTQEIAANCIAKRAAAKKNHGRWSNEDLEAVARMHEEGMTYRAIGERIGKSGSHARNLHVKALRNRRRDHADPFQSLGVRARNCLFSRGLNTIEAVRAAHESGFLKKIPNMGKASIDEVAAMLDAVRPNTRNQPSARSADGWIEQLARDYRKQSDETARRTIEAIRAACA